MYAEIEQLMYGVICKRPFFANKKITFRNLSRTPHLSFEGVSYYNRSLNLSPKKGNFANSDKNFRGVCYIWNSGGPCNGQCLPGLLDRQSYTSSAKTEYIQQPIILIHFGDSPWLPWLWTPPFNRAAIFFWIFSFFLGGIFSSLRYAGHFSFTPSHHHGRQGCRHNHPGAVGVSTRPQGEAGCSEVAPGMGGMMAKCWETWNRFCILVWLMDDIYIYMCVYDYICDYLPLHMMINDSMWW